MALFMAVSMLGLSACNKNNANQSASTGRSNRGSPLAMPQQGQFYTAGVGQITSDSAYGQQFTAAVLGLLSASMSTSNVGAIDPTTGVTFQGYVQIDNSGNLVPSGSVLAITVNDYFSANGVQDPNTGQPVPPIYISVPATSGYAYNGNATLTFGDNFGSITLTGTYGAANGQFSGSVSYQNQQNQDSGSPHSSSYMGSFTIQTCGFFRCQ